MAPRRPHPRRRQPDGRLLSLTERTRDSLLDSIRAGAFAGGRLPPESELAERLGVSRTTVRAALQSLAADGIVSRRRRLGTYVNTHLLRSSMRLNRLVPFTALIEQLGHEPAVEQRSRRVEEGDLVVERLLRADGRPVIVVADIVPLSELAVPPEEVADAESTFAFLEANGVATVDYATSEFIPRIATRDEPDGLEVPPGSPYIELFETHFTRDHRQIAVSRVGVDDSRIRFSLLRRGI